MLLSEAGTLRKFIIPKLQAAGWDNDPHSIAEQRSITDGRIIPAGKGFLRRPPRRVDYLLRFERNFPLADVEATALFLKRNSVSSRSSRRSRLSWRNHYEEKEFSSENRPGISSGLQRIGHRDL